MSAFFVAINRSRSPFDAGIARDMMRQIAIFGHDVSHLVIRDHFSIGYQARWSVPEEIDEVQPLFDAQSGQWFVFIGRIDNREKLIKALSEPALKSQSDAQLMQRFCQQFGQDRLNDVIGPFVFVLFDASTNEVLAARDAMGGRYLCYSITEKFILLATYEMAIVAHDSIDYCFNQEKVARVILGEMDSVPTSTIEGITPVKPGECIAISGADTSCFRFYRPPSKAISRRLSDADYALEFRRLFTQAVQRRLRCIGRVGTMLSGGLDSVPMTAVAQDVSSEPITAFSWVFDQYTEVDERHYSTPICSRLGITQVPIVCDNLWPQFDETTLLNPVLPSSIPYTAWQRATFESARLNDVKTILSGVDGDLLYEHAHTILYELIVARRWADTLREAVRLWQSANNKWAMVKRYVLLPLPGVETFVAWRARRRAYRSRILQPSISAKMRRTRHWLARERTDHLRAQQWQTVFDGFSGEDIAFGRYLEAKFAIDRRYPFRDRELCEFMTAVPAHQLTLFGVKRPIVKRAFRTELGEKLLMRNTKTNFNPVIKDGFIADKKSRGWYLNSGATWSEYINPDYFQDQSADNFQKLILQWQCGYYAYWKSVCYTVTFCMLEQSKLHK